jgi:hypothetical protein
VTIDYAAILAAQQTIDPIVAPIAAGIRQLLLAAGHGPVILGPLVNAPDIVVGLAPYPLEDTLTGEVLLGIQVRIRGTKNGGAQPVIDRQEAILNTLQQLINVEIADGITIAVCWRALSAPLGFDSVDRPEVFDSYYLRSDRPGVI